MPSVVPGYTGGGWVGRRSGDAETRDLIFLFFLPLMMNPTYSYCVLIFSAIVALLLQSSFPTAVFVHSSSIGLVPTSFRARLTRRGIISKDVQGWTFDEISIQTRQTSRNTRWQQPACRCHAGTLECTVASVAH